MISNIKLWSVIFLLGILISCSAKSREAKMAQYLEKLGVPPTASVGLLNPAFCGSCTEYSINWLVNKKTSGKKVIVITAELNDEHESRLKKAGYLFFKGDQQVMSRNGVTLSAFTAIELENGKIESMKVIK